MIYAACVAGGLLVAFALMLALFAVQNARAKKKRARTRNKDSPQSGAKMEFSKYIIHSFLIPYFFGVGAGFCFWKAKAENIVKIKRENPAETEGISFRLNNITP